MRLGTREVAALPVLRRAGGLLLALPDGAITDEDRATGRIAGVTDSLGPTSIITVEGLPDEEEADPIDIQMVLLDVPQNLFKVLRYALGEVTWPVNTIWPQSPRKWSTM